MWGVLFLSVSEELRVHLLAQQQTAVKRSSLYHSWDYSLLSNHRVGSPAFAFRDAGVVLVLPAFQGYADSLFLCPCQWPLSGYVSGGSDCHTSPHSRSCAAAHGKHQQFQREQLFYFILFCSVLFCSILFYFIVILFYSVLFYLILFYLALSYFTLFYHLILLCFILF